MFPQMFPGVGKIINQSISVNCYFTYFSCSPGTHLKYIWEWGHICDTFGREKDTIGTHLGCLLFNYLPSILQLLYLSCNYQLIISGHIQDTFRKNPGPHKAMSTKRCCNQQRIWSVRTFFSAQLVSLRKLLLLVYIF